MKKRFEVVGLGLLDYYLFDVCVFFVEVVYIVEDINCVFEKEVLSFFRDELMFCCIVFKKRYILLCYKGFKVEYVCLYMVF